MRTIAVIGLALLAGAIGYGVSRMHVETMQAERSIDAKVAKQPADALPASAEGSAPGDRESPRASFVHEGPNVATMSAPATFGALPPESMPLAQAADALAAMMRSGSREATLRLLRQTRECARHRDSQRTLDMMLGIEAAARERGSQGVTMVSARPGAERMSIDAVITQSAGEVAKREERCAGFEDAQDQLRFEAQWRAALMGELEGLLEFSLAPAIDRGRAFEQHDRIERFRARAPGFLQQALDQGSAQAAFNLMHALDPGWQPAALRGGKVPPPEMRTHLRQLSTPSPLRQVAGTDAVAAYRYAFLCARVCPDTRAAEAAGVAQRLRGDIEPDARQRAEAEAERLREQHFAQLRGEEWLTGVGEEPPVAPPTPPAAPPPTSAPAPKP